MGIVRSMMLGYLFGVGVIAHPLAGSGRDCSIEWHCRYRLSELAEYRKVHGHCNVSQKYSENTKLGRWVETQRYQYSWHQEGKTSRITLPRIQALERLGFDWKPSISRWQGKTKKAGLDMT
jgi:hypothetical protein